ncbi:MAG: DNA mismatch repair protein MutS [Acidobacteria bacterium]|nr:DNA mismatch repair protein MutS [Acidobacteriota bacterium]
MLEKSEQAYAARERQHGSKRDDERRTSARLARLRLATFLPGIGAMIWWVGFGGDAIACAAGVTLLLAFAALVVRHARVEARAAWFDALRVVNARGISRLYRRWDALPDAQPPAGVEVDGHPYAIDLDVFGRASVFQWIGPAATTFGSRLLAEWLLHPAPPVEVRSRQDAIAELSSCDAWREELAAFGVVAGASRPEPIETFLFWAASSAAPLPAYAAVRLAVYAILVSMWGLLLLHLTGAMPNSMWGIPLILGVVLSFFTAKPVSHAFDQAGAGERTVRQYAGVLAHIESQHFASRSLAALQQRLTVSGDHHPTRSAPAAMRTLNRILGFADLRRGAALLHFPIQAFTLWDFHCLFALDTWRRGAGLRVRDWFQAAGELDALSCLAGIRRDNPDWCFPTVSLEHQYVATALGHPLLPPARRVTNDVRLGPPGTVLLVTGSNMSGKSTLLRAIGVNALLAEAGAPVCASMLRIPPCDVQTSIRIQDSLERGVSYFMAALARLKGVIDAAERPAVAHDTDDRRVLLYLLDEILQGTNSAERGIAVQAVTRHLLEAGAIGAMTTHDLNLAAEEPLKSHARLVHFTEIVDEGGTMKFDYSLREGLATSRNALRLMELIGIDLTQP